MQRTTTVRGRLIYRGDQDPTPTRTAGRSLLCRYLVEGASLYGVLPLTPVRIPAVNAALYGHVKVDYSNGCIVATSPMTALSDRFDPNVQMWSTVLSDVA